MYAVAAGRMIGACGIVLCSTLVSVAGDPARRLVTVSADAVVHGTPDGAELSLAIKTESDDLLTSRATNDKRLASLIDMAAKQGIAAKELGLQKLDVSFRFDKDQSRFAYRVERALTVHIHDLTKVDPLLSEILKQGGYAVTGLEFRISDEQEHRLQATARRQAVGAAKEKAASLAELNGLKLGKAWSIGEEPGDTRQRPFVTSVTPVVGSLDSDRSARQAVAPANAARANEISARNDSHGPAARFVAFGIDGEKEPQKGEGFNPGANPLGPGQVDVAASVTIEFELLAE